MLARLQALATLCMGLLLASCVLTPGKFTSDLVLHRGGRFTFSYKGDVTAVDPNSSMDGMTAAPSESETAAEKAERQAREADKSKEKNARYRAIVDAISKEKGVRAIRHLGDGKFELDYQISGTLDHAFVFPFNSDAEIVIPFLMIEPRGDGSVRVKAVGYVGSQGGLPVGPMGAAAPPNDKIDGSFTIRTDAEVLMHNDESGPVRAAGMAVYQWKIDALSKDAPVLTARIGG